MKSPYDVIYVIFICNESVAETPAISKFVIPELDTTNWKKAAVEPGWAVSVTQSAVNAIPDVAVIEHAIAPTVKGNFNVSMPAGEDTAEIVNAPLKLTTLPILVYFNVYVVSQVIDPDVVGYRTPFASAVPNVPSS